MTALATVLLETLVERHEERIALAGTANLTRGGLLDFQGSLRPILEALEEEVILLKLIGEVEPSTTRVRIGDENEFEDLRATSVVSTGYGPGATIVGGLGVLGPDPDGLPRHHRHGAGRGTLRRRPAGAELTTRLDATGD